MAEALMVFAGNVVLGIWVLLTCCALAYLIKQFIKKEYNDK